MRAEGNFEVEETNEEQPESIQPEAEDKRKLEPVSADVAEASERDYERDAEASEDADELYKQKLPALEEAEGESLGEPEDNSDASSEQMPSFREAEDESLGELEDNSDASSEQMPSFREAMNDPSLFSSREAKDYRYSENELGKRAAGVLGLEKNPERDPVAQREAGGEERRDDDDGGHLLGARFGAAPGKENIDAQNRNLNRGDYKHLENGWEKSLKDEDKIYANVETYKNGNERPSAYMGWTVTEHPDGTRDWDAFSFSNESRKTQEQWNKEVEDIPITDDYPNAMNEVYEANDYDNEAY